MMSMRIAICGVILSLAVVSMAVPVTVITPTADVPHVLEVVSEVTGVKHTAPGFEREFLTLHVTDVEPEELKAKIAEAIGAEWREEGGKWILFRSTIKLKQLKEEDIARFKPLIERSFEGYAPPSEIIDRSALQNYLTQIRRMNELDETARSPARRIFQDLQAMSPGRRTMAAVISQIPVNEILSLGPSERIVYSMTGGTKVRRLPSNTLSILQRGRREQAWLLENRPDVSDRSTEFNFLRGVPIPEHPWFLVITTDGMRNFTSSVIWYETEQNRSSAGQMFAWTFSDHPPVSTEQTQATAPSAVTLDADDLRITAFFRKQRVSEEMMISPQALFTSFRDREPYSIVWDTILTALAKERKLDIVASPDCKSWSGLVKMIDPLLPVTTEVVDQFLHSGLTRSKRDRDWLLIQPTLSIATMGPEPDRDALRKFCAVLAESDTPPASAYARYAADSQCDNAWNIGVLPFEVITLGSVNVPTGGFSAQTWRALQLAGSLSSSQIEAMRNGNRFPVI